MTDQAPITPETMSNFDAAMIVEGCWSITGYEPCRETFHVAAQRLINTGDAWILQGYFGRTCNDLIAAGWCVPAEDYVEGEWAPVDELEVA